MYSAMGPDRNLSGLPQSMRSTEALVLVAKKAKMVSMQRAEMWSQSMNPRAYAMGSHSRVRLSRVPAVPQEPLREAHLCTQRETPGVHQGYTQDPATVTGTGRYPRATVTTL